MTALRHDHDSFTASDGHRWLLLTSPSVNRHLGNLFAASTAVCSKKRDGRTLDHATLREFLLLAVRRVREGEKPAKVLKSPEMNRTSVYRWLSAAEGRGRGKRARASRPATRRPSKLTPKQRAQVLRWIKVKDPRQNRLDFGLWT